MTNAERLREFEAEYKGHIRHWLGTLRMWQWWNRTGETGALVSDIERCRRNVRDSIRAFRDFQALRALLEATAPDAALARATGHTTNCVATAEHLTYVANCCCSCHRAV